MECVLLKKTIQASVAAIERVNRVILSKFVNPMSHRQRIQVWSTNAACEEEGESVHRVQPERQTISLC